MEKNEFFLGWGPSQAKHKQKAEPLSEGLNQSAHPSPAISGPSSSSAPGSMSTSPLKRMERRIKGWFKCILWKQKQLDHMLSKLESHILQGEPVVVDDPPPPPPPDLEGDSDELYDCVDEDFPQMERR